MPKKKAGNAASENLKKVDWKAAAKCEVTDTPMINGLHYLKGDGIKPEIVEEPPTDEMLLRALGLKPPPPPTRYYVLIVAAEQIPGAAPEVRTRRPLMTLQHPELVNLVGKWVAERLGVELPRVQRIVKTPKA